MIVPTLALARTQDQYAQHISQKTQASFDRLRIEIQQRKRELELQRRAAQQQAQQTAATEAGNSIPSTQAVAEPVAGFAPPVSPTAGMESTVWSAVSNRAHEYDGASSSEAYGDSSSEPFMLGGRHTPAGYQRIEESSKMFELVAEDESHSEFSSGLGGTTGMVASYIEMQNALATRNRISKSTNARRRKVNDASASVLKAHLEKKQKEKAAESEQLSRLKDLDVAQ
ncbi:hypothetical protein FVE85_0361 [Porphyridium purpureum]|uniref:Uncharacterized protein n=1 Tax=Porphyridium purpureum TaxID=35688 RepID=A0A5J4Z0K4_PORPP|nr:hypothetical protein FVE85_0361 [Porphyridium purpureum]|eukprot:POR2276..scf208_2